MVSNSLTASESCPNRRPPPDDFYTPFVMTSQLHLLNLSEMESRPISGTDSEQPGTSHPVLSPDGQSVVYFDGNMRAARRTPAIGGTAVTVWEEGSGGNPRTMSWTASDMLLFSQPGGIVQTPSNGGTPQPLVAAQDGEEFGSPQILPGGDWVLSTVKLGDGTWDEAQIAVHNLDSGERRVIWEGGSAPRYLPSGHIVYAQANTLFAFPFDLGSLERTGGPVSIVEGLQRSINFSHDTANYLVSDNGTLVYVQGGSSAVTGRTLVWVDRQGNAEPMGAPTRNYTPTHVRLSPDDTSVVVQSDGDIWLFDVIRQTLTRLTFEGAGMPAWTPDGQFVSYRSERADTPLNLFRASADGSGTEERLTTSELRQTGTSWSPDGQYLAFYEVPGVGGPQDRDIWIMPLDGDREPSPFLQTQFTETAPTFSPDGQWVAYVSDESGGNQVYVLPFPGPGGKRQISTDGGVSPVWALDGQELFYLNGDQMMAVDIETEPGFRASTPRLLFEAGFIPDSIGVAAFGVTADGQQFLMVQDASIIISEAQRPQINIVLNWFEELKERVPGP